MKIASYNIWNSDRDYKQRLEMLTKVIGELDLDVIALQEVRNNEVVEYVSSETGLKYSCWQPYPDCEEGLAVLSKYPVTYNWNNWDNDMDFHNSGVISVSISVDNKKIGVTNVHLDYKRALYRELEIVKAVKRIEKNIVNDYEIMLGDFNTYPVSSIHGYLTGTQSLLEHSTRWIDLYDSYSARMDYNQNITLDFYNNPRWDNEYALDVPGRFDWILLMNPYPNKYPLLKEFRVIGKEGVNGITPSDHYGVYCELDV